MHNENPNEKNASQFAYRDENIDGRLAGNGFHVFIENKHPETNQIARLVNGLVRLHKDRCIFRNKIDWFLIPEINTAQTFGDQSILSRFYETCSKS